MKTGLKNICGIECLAVEGNNPKVGIVFFHGYGANMHDLFPLWEMWHQNDVNWYFPNGIQSLPMGYYEGRAWFQIDVAALEEALRKGTHREMSQTIPPELDETLNQLEIFLRELATRHERLIIGGFSQGAMCASHLAMIKGTPLDGLILLSGSLIAETKFPKEAKSLPFYQAHGSRDPILPLSGAKMLEEKLKSYNFQGQLKVFNGGHEIPMEVIHDVKAFIGAMLSK
jgi:phospholipase/carboxylesterase